MDVFTRGAAAIRLISLALGLATTVPAVAVAKPWYIREQRTVWVNGHKEVWQLRWRERPSTAFVGPWDGSFHPEREGNFQHAEAGDIDLLRLRRGKIIDRLNLTQFFPIDDGETFPVALIPRWPIVLPEKNEGNRSGGSTIGSSYDLSSMWHRPTATTDLSSANYVRC